MAYCTPAQVRLLIATDLSDENLTELITLADSDLDDKLAGQTMSDVQKTKCSMRLAAVMVAQRAPVKESLSGASLDWGDRVKEWQNYVAEQIGKLHNVALVRASRWHAIDSLEEGY